MKTTRKIGLVTALLVSLSLASQAQTSTSTSGNGGSGTSVKEWRISVGPEAGIPIGDFSNEYNWNIGGSAQVDIPIIQSLYVTVNAGYQNFFVKNGNFPDNVADKNLQLIPVKAGLKYFFLGDLLYVQGEAGASFLANKSDVGASNAAAFVYAPTVGVLLKLAPKNYIDVGFRFEGTSSFYNGGSSNNFLGLRVAYSFGL